MSNTDQAPEPSMEEILASIRRIISDDEPAEDAAPEAEQETAEAAPVEAVEEVAAEQLEPEPEAAAVVDDSDIFELTDVAAEEADQPAEDAVAMEPDFDAVPAEDDTASEPEDTVDEFDGDIDFVDAETDEVEVLDDAPEEVMAVELEKPSDPAERLVSGGTNESAGHAFQSLAGTLISQKGNSRTLEDLLEDLLRPMLAAWLDENLPEMTERLVRDEIERISHRGGR